MDQTFLQLVSLVVSLSNQVAQLQQENARLKEQSSNLAADADSAEVSPRWVHS